MRVSIVATGIESEAAKGKIFTGGNGGGTKVSPPAQVEMIERATPNTVGMQQVQTQIPAPQTATAAQPVIGNPGVSGRDVLRGLTAPSPISVQPKPQPEKQERVNSPVPVPAPAPSQETNIPEPMGSIDMFEQSEFVTESASKQIDDASLRGQTLDNAFIPPKPMEVDMDVPENGVGSYISGFNAQHVPEEKKKDSGTGLQLNPPAKPAVLTNVPKQERSPSLFERITGSVQTHIDSFRDDNEMIKSQPQEASESPSQGRLNIDAPSKPAVQIDDELDIPAFLRRQAN